MKRFIFSITFASVGTGCAPLLDAQGDLVAQARRGIELAQSNRAACESVHGEYAKLKRQRLDDAFDADVHERFGDGGLTPEWVITHRFAYGAALDAYTQQQRELDESDVTARRNLQAVDAALERLQWLQDVQNRWLRVPKTEEER